MGFIRRGETAEHCIILFAKADKMIQTKLISTKDVGESLRFRTHPVRMWTKVQQWSAPQNSLDPDLTHTGNIPLSVSFADSSPKGGAQSVEKPCHSEEAARYFVGIPRIFKHFSFKICRFPVV